MDIKLKNVIVRDYKKIVNQTVNLSEKLTCIIGDNASGKTTLLEGISGRYSKGIINDYRTSNSYVFSVDVSDLDFLQDEMNTLLTATFHFDGENWNHNEFILEGHEEYLEEIIKYLNVDIKYFYAFQKKVHAMLLEIDSELKGIPSEVWDADVYGRPIIFFDRDVLDEEINRFSEFIENETNLHQSDTTPFMDFNFNKYVDRNIFDISFMEEKEFLTFYDSVKDLTIEADGYKYDLEGMKDYYYKLKEKIEYLKQFMRGKKKQIKNELDILDDKEKNISEAIDKYNELLQDIEKNCLNYLTKSNIISSSFINARQRDKIELNDLGKKIVGILGVPIVDASYDSLSDGEKWVVYLAKRVSEQESKLLFIDEPGMYLNPSIQRRLFEVFELLIDEEYQIIYTTHMSHLVVLRHDSKVLRTSIDDEITVEPMDLSNIEEATRITVGKLLIMSLKKMILVEGKTDQMLLEYYINKYTEKDLDRYNLIQCAGEGITQMIGICVNLGLDFVALVDYDKVKNIKRALGNKYEQYSDVIHVAGNEDIQEIESYLSEEDVLNLTEIHNGDNKMDVTKMKKHFENDGELSEGLIEKLNIIVNRMRLD